MINENLQTGLFRKSRIYDWTPWFSISWIALSISTAAVWSRPYNQCHEMEQQCVSYRSFSVRLVSGNTWENADSLTYPVLNSQPSPDLWVMTALEIGDSLITSRGSFTFQKKLHSYSQDLLVQSNMVKREIWYWWNQISSKSVWYWKQIVQIKKYVLHS